MHIAVRASARATGVALGFGAQDGGELPTRGP